MNVITLQKFQRIVEIQTNDNRIFTIILSWSDNDKEYKYTIKELIDNEHQLKYNGSTDEFAGTVDVVKLLLEYLIKEMNGLC